jgi:hypothetical protein
MAKKNFPSKLHDAVENYYHYNPDTLMPLMMVALAANGKLRIAVGTSIPENPACVLSPKEIINYDWVELDVSLRSRVNKWIKDGVTTVAVDMEIGRSLLQIYKTLKNNDERDVVREYHHRIGRLVHHSSNEACEKAQRQYATFVLAEALLDTPISYLKEKYLNIFNHILVNSGIQPKRPRLRIARALSALLQYDGKGLVYNPFAGCSIAGAMLQSKNNFFGDGDTNDKLYAAGLLLNYGMGVSNEHFLQRDSTQWLNGKKIDYIISTYTGFINGESAFDFCLGKCMGDPDFKGRYAGMVLPKEIFEKETANFKEALKRDWIDTIALLPFGEVAVMVDAQKAIAQKGLIRFIDGTNPLSQSVSMQDLIEDNMYSEYIEVSNVKKKGYLKSLIVSELPEQDGYKKVRLGDIVSRIPRVVLDLDKIEEDKRVLAYINRDETYYGQVRPNENIERRPINNLFNPAYHLDEDCLIVNAAGPAEPRIFDVDFGSAFFEDGYAFALGDFKDYRWLINELNETYVLRQLHPYGQNNMVPEPVTEEDYLNLIVYMPIIEEEEVEEEVKVELSDEEKARDALPAGFELKDGNKKYTILNYLSCGAFGYTYRAEMLDQHNGSKEIIAIKEFYPRLSFLMCFRENTKTCRVTCDPKEAATFDTIRETFRSESKFLLTMADTKDNHVTEVKTSFDYESTGTSYYVMKFYEGASLKDMIISNLVPTSEQLIIDKIVVPMCKALHVMFKHNILHLDIKPENVVIDENGEAILIDFGVAHQYDKDGKLISMRETPSRSPFSAPENKGGMKYFGPQADIFGVAATLFNLVSRKWPHPIRDPQDKEMAFEVMNCSEGMKQAIAEGMSLYSNDRPANAQLFLNLFPGCEDIKLD